jgi:ankyrin repeat protein
MKTLRAISIRFVAFLVAFVMGVAFIFGRNFYVYRQAHFADAALMGRFARMKFLYSLGVDVNAPGCPYRNCFNPIWGAAFSGYDDEVRFLLERGADVNAKTNFGSSPLMAASFAGHDSTVRLLLSHGADVNADRDGDTPLTYARNRHHPDIVALLRQAGARDAP